MSIRLKLQGVLGQMTKAPISAQTKTGPMPGQSKVGPVVRTFPIPAQLYNADIVGPNAFQYLNPGIQYVCPVGTRMFCSGNYVSCT